MSAAALGALLFSIQIATFVFRDLPGDKILAGRVAGRAFTGAYAIALAAAVFVVLVVFAQGAASLLDRLAAGVFVVAAAAESFWIAPSIVRHAAGWPGTFASLHATGGALHLLLSVLALFFAWRLLAERP